MRRNEYPRYHEQHLDCIGAYCYCMAQSNLHAIEIAAKMQAEYIKNGQRDKDLAEAARVSQERRTAMRHPNSYPLATNSPLPASAPTSEDSKCNT